MKWPEPPPNKLAFIGEYVYLPYAHMSMCDAVPFISHSKYIVSGKPFIKRADWTLGNVLTLIDFQPRTLFGYEIIKSYAAEGVPLFISHIREIDAEMWAALIAARPQYDVAPNYIGRKALLRTLASPIGIPPSNAGYPVAWEWDGTELRTNSANAYSSTWGNIKEESVDIRVTPKADAVVVVNDNCWVTPDTVFVD